MPLPILSPAPPGGAASPPAGAPSPLAEILARGAVWRGDRLAGGGATRRSGFAALDAELPGGGWPCGALVDVMHARPGSGELALLLPAIAEATARDEWVFLLAPPYRVFAPAWQAAGVRLSRLALLAPAGSRVARCAADELWAAEQILRAGSAAIALLWLPRAATAAQLRRLQVAAEAGGGTGFFLQDEARLAQPSPAPLRLRLTARAGGLEVDLLKRRGAPQARPLLLAPPSGPRRAAPPFPAGRDVLARPGLSPAAA